MKYQLIGFICVVAAFVGCKSSIEKKIASQADECKDENCKIKIADFTDFQWDKMYVFNYAIPPEEIDGAIGMNYNNYEEFTRPWIFVRNNKIVYSENNPYDIENPVDGEVAFENPDSIRFRVFTPKTATFSVRKETSSNANYYELY